MPIYKRTPPGFRKLDSCSKCRAFQDECEFYDMKNKDPEDMICDDFKPYTEE